MMLQKWQTLYSHLVIDNQWCRVRQDTVRLPSGQIVDDYFINIRPDVALILPITFDRKIVFVRQYRHGVGEILLELPAGSFNPQREDSLSAAKRELQEETGYVASRWTKVATLYDNPVKDTNKIHLFLAEEVHRQGKQRLDITEDIEVVLVSFPAVKDKIRSGELCVSGTLAALLLGLNIALSE
ncbi:MAG: NUDIX hydrolase [Cyanophyceae cyanobacterium]